MSPQFFSSRRIVRDNKLGPTRDQLRSCRAAHEYWCGPTDLHLPWRLPNFLPRLLVERHDEGRRAILFITLHDHEVVEENRRRAGPHANCAEISERCFPRELAFEVVSVETFGTEERVDQPAVSCRSRGCIRTLPVTIVVGRALPGSRLPEELSTVAIQAEDFEGVFVIRPDAVRMQKLSVSVHVLHSFRPWHDGSFNRGCQEHSVAPNDRRRMRSPLDRGLPLDVPGRTPFQRQVLFVRNTGAIRTTPLRPVPS